MPPDELTRLEWAMFNLLHAVEEIATAMRPKATGEAAGQTAILKVEGRKPKWLCPRCREDLRPAPLPKGVADARLGK